jgi:branched-chain amino acid transport system substrate-binding protein
MVNKMALSRLAKIIAIAVIIIAVVIASVVYYYFFVMSAKPVPEYIPIGTSVDLTGGTAFIEKGFHYAYQWAVNKINEQGGIYVKEYGKKIPVKYIYYDDGGDVAGRAATNFETLITRDGVVALFGKGGPTGVTVTASVVERYKVPTLLNVPVGSVPELKTYKYVWNLMISIEDPDIGISTLLFRAMQDYKLESNKKIAIVVIASDEAKIMADSWEQWAPRYGYEVVYRTVFPSGTTDFTSIILAVKATGADILMYQSTPPEGITFWTQCKSLGYRPKIAWLEMASRGYGWIQTMGEMGEYVLTAGMWYPDMPGGFQKYNASNKELAEDFMRDTGEYWDQALGHCAANVFILADAIERAGSLDREKINQAIGETDGYYMGVYVKYVNQEAGSLAILLQWQEGKCKVVYPMKYAEASIVYPLPPWG